MMQPSDSAAAALTRIIELTRQLKDALGQHQQHTGQTPKNTVEEIVIPKLLGDAPDWAKKQKPDSGWTVSQGDVFNMGHFCVYHYTNSKGQTFALVQHRKERDAKGLPLLGAVGGYADPGESVLEALCRETREEVLNDQGNPIFTPDPQRFRFLFPGSDRPSPDAPAISYIGWGYELNEQEYECLSVHCDRLKSDPNYRRHVRDQSGGEVENMEIRTIEELSSDIMRQRFKLSRQHDAYRRINELCAANDHNTIINQDPGMQALG